MQPLYEAYRPKRWEEIVGQEKAVKTIERLRQRGGLAGRVLYVTGPSGSGKTTIARLIAAEVSAEWATIEMDAADLDIETVRDIEAKSRGLALGGAKWCVILNEAHRMRSSVVSRLLTTLELPSVQRNVTVILTTTTSGSTLFEDNFDAGPFLSRAIMLPLSQRGLCEPFAQRALEIARAEGLDGQPIEKYQRLAKDCRNNLREMLSRIEAGVMCGE